MIIGAVKETSAGERRAAMTPQSVKKLVKLGYDVRVESGVGLEANFPDSMYEESGAKVVDANTVWSSDIVLKVQPPTEAEAGKTNSDTTLISFIWPCLLYTSPSPRDQRGSRMPSSA